MKIATILAVVGFGIGFGFSIRFSQAFDTGSWEEDEDFAKDAPPFSMTLTSQSTTTTTTNLTDNTVTTLQTTTTTTALNGGKASTTVQTIKTTIQTREISPSVTVATTSTSTSTTTRTARPMSMDQGKLTTDHVQGSNLTSTQTKGQNREESTRSTSTAFAFACPPPEEIFPCTCTLRSILCQGREVTQRSVDSVFNAIFTSANKNNNNSNTGQSLIQLNQLQVSSTNVPKLDLTSLFNVPSKFRLQINTLVLSSNDYLAKIVGPEPEPDESNESQGKIVASAIYISENRKLTNECLSKFLGYFDPSSICKLSLRETGVVGGQFPISERAGAGEVEFLPGLAALTNLEKIDLSHNQIRYLGGGQFRRNKNLRRIHLSRTGPERYMYNEERKFVIGDNAFLLDLPGSGSTNGFDVDVASNNTLIIDLSSSELTFESFTGSPSTFLTRRPTEIILRGNKLRSVPPKNRLDFTGNPIQCDSNVRWLKRENVDFERRVFGVVCQNDPGQTAFTSNLV